MRRFGISAATLPPGDRDRVSRAPASGNATSFRSCWFRRSSWREGALIVALVTSGAPAARGAGLARGAAAVPAAPVRAVAGAHGGAAARESAAALDALSRTSPKVSDGVRLALGIRRAGEIRNGPSRRLRVSAGPADLHRSRHLPQTIRARLPGVPVRGLLGGGGATPARRRGRSARCSGCHRCPETWPVRPRRPADRRHDGQQRAAAARRRSRAAATATGSRGRSSTRCRRTSPCSTVTAPSSPSTTPGRSSAHANGVASASADRGRRQLPGRVPGRGRARSGAPTTALAVIEAACRGVPRRPAGRVPVRRTR